MFAFVTSRRLQSFQKMWGKEEATSVAPLFNACQTQLGTDQGLKTELFFVCLLFETKSQCVVLAILEHTI